MKASEHLTCRDDDELEESPDSDEESEDAGEGDYEYWPDDDEE